MEKVKLFKLRKILSIIIGLVGIIITLMYVLALFTNYGSRGEFSFMGIILLVSMGYQYRTFNKFYFHYNKQEIKWNFPGMSEPKKVELSKNSFEISKDWKGIILINKNQSIEISTDGLWERDKKLISKRLTEYYS